jgi:hypothetical protein
VPLLDGPGENGLLRDATWDIELQISRGIMKVEGMMSDRSPTHTTPYYRPAGAPQFDEFDD